MLGQRSLNSLTRMLTSTTTTQSSPWMVVIFTEPATTPVQWQMTDRSTFALPNEIYP